MKTAEEILKKYLMNKHHVFAASTSQDQIDAMRKDIVLAMEEYASARIAEMEREMKEAKRLLQQYIDFRADCTALNDPAITEIDDKHFPF